MNEILNTRIHLAPFDRGMFFLSCVITGPLILWGIAVSQVESD